MLTSLDFIYCLAGWFLFNLYKLNLDKNQFDKEDKPFNLKHYGTLAWDDWAVTFSAAFVILGLSPDIFLYCSNHFDWMKGIYWSSVIPFLVGSFGGLLFQKLYNWIKEFKK